MSYGATLSELFRRSAWYVHRILLGTEPAELPIEAYIPHLGRARLRCVRL
jgi:hypothetical protein